MKINEIFILKEVVDDLNSGKDFYDLKEAGVGDYFWDCMVADIESLILYAGIHPKTFDVYRMLAKRFPFAIYYEILRKNVYIIAVLPIRRDPFWIENILKERI